MPLVYICLWVFSSIAMRWYLVFLSEEYLDDKIRYNHEDLVEFTTAVISIGTWMIVIWLLFALFVDFDCGCNWV